MTITNVDFPPSQPRAPQLLSWRRTGRILSFETEEFYRKKIVENLRRFDNLGMDNNPDGRRLAYLDACSWDDNSKRAVDNRSLNGSSCGMFLHNVLAFCGARSKHLLKSPYNSRKGEVINMLLDFVEEHGGLVNPNRRDFKDIFKPKPADMVYIYNLQSNSQHIFMFSDVSVSGNLATFHSIDGGQKGVGFKDKPCNGIQARKRTMILSVKNETVDGETIQVKKFGKKFVQESKRPIVRWLDMGKCKNAFTENYFEIIRNQGNAALKSYTKPLPADPDTPGPPEPSSPPAD